MNITALILAAGSGSRIGTPKLMLEYKEKSFLRIITDKITEAGIKNIICVVNNKTFDWAMKTVPEIKYVLNPNPEDGMLSSVYYGAEVLDEDALIIPVDHPFVEVSTYRLLLREYERYSTSVIKPEYKNKSGHPIIIPYELMKSIKIEDSFIGLNEVIKKSGCHQVYVEVQDKGIAKNVNTLDDLSII
jgi:molybdenum cofactor cytidylyltransferase